MRNFNTLLLLICLSAIGLQAQETDLTQLLHRQYNEQMQSLVTETEVWRVDSTYCWANVPAIGAEIPTIRSYNLEFSEYSGQILREERQQFVNNEWINSGRKAYIYDANDNPEETIDEGWLPQQNTWEFTDRNLFNYNESSNNFDDITTQKWENSAWSNRFQTINTFHPTHFKVTQSDNYIFENEEWVLDNRFYFSVNINTLLEQGNLFQKRNEDGFLANLSRTFFYYDEMGNDTLTTLELNDSGWYFNSRVLKEFENGKTTLRTEQSYVADTWVNTIQTATEYTTAGEQELVTVSAWNAQENAFVPSFRTGYTYDSANNLTEFSTDIYQNDAWVYNGRCQIYWSEYEVEVDPNPNTATTDLIVQDCKIANPLQAGGSFSCTDWEIDGKGTVEVYNLNGQIITTQTVFSTDNISLENNLTAGFYTLVLRDARGMVWRKKIMIGL